MNRNSFVYKYIIIPLFGCQKNPFSQIPIQVEEKAVRFGTQKYGIDRNIIAEYNEYERNYTEFYTKQDLMNSRNQFQVAVYALNEFITIVSNNIYNFRDVQRRMFDEDMKLEIIKSGITFDKYDTELNLFVLDKMLESCNY